MAKTLSEWLNALEAVKPQSTIELGLARMRRMLDKIKWKNDVPIIIVGGTNGKGSTCLMLESIYQASGRKVATHTSPHILRFNERARFNGRELGDEALAAGFEEVDAVRGGEELTYFEFTLLAILCAFRKACPDVMVLEVGLGGRLDAVNALEPAASIVTAVGVEHETFLGTTRDAVGWEKAHIYRAGKPAVCADPVPPNKLTEYAQALGAELLLRGVDFDVQETASGAMKFKYKKESFLLPMPALYGKNQMDNAAGVLAVVESLQKTLPVSKDSMAKGLLNVRLPGRFEIISKKPLVIVDVGHNPHAAARLLENLASCPAPGKTTAVFGMLKDKDMMHVVRIVMPEIDRWFISGLPPPRGAKAQELKSAMLEAGVSGDDITVFDTVPQALDAAYRRSSPEDRILIFGSFVTVTEALPHLHVL